MNYQLKHILTEIANTDNQDWVIQTDQTINFYPETLEYRPLGADVMLGTNTEEVAEYQRRIEQLKELFTKQDYDLFASYKTAPGDEGGTELSFIILPSQLIYDFWDNVDPNGELGSQLLFEQMKYISEHRTKSITIHAGPY